MRLPDGIQNGADFWSATKLPWSATKLPGQETPDRRFVFGSGGRIGLRAFVAQSTRRREKTVGRRGDLM
jgi:hypothetical protein